MKPRRPSTILRRVSDGAKILRGPWPERTGSAEPARPESAVPPSGQRTAPGTSGRESRAVPGGADAGRRGESASEGEVLAPNRIHLGFVVRDCAVALGRTPTPEELAHWANHQADERGEFRLFGREISTAEAKVILAHPGRTVTVRPERARGRGPGEPPISSRG